MPNNDDDDDVNTKRKDKLVGWLGFYGILSTQIAAISSLK